jgi:hypothetical protein
MKICTQQEEVIQNHENEHSIGKVEARRGKYKRLELGSGQAYDLQVTRLPLYVKPVLTGGLCVVQTKEFSITCLLCEMYT